MHGIRWRRASPFRGGRRISPSRTGDATSFSEIFANVRRYWRDTLSLVAGISGWFRPEPELFLGAGLETAATPDETLDPELPDAATVQGAFGTRWEFLPRFFLGGSHTYLYYLPRDNIGKSVEERIGAICAELGFDMGRLDPSVVARLQLLAEHGETISDCERMVALARKVSGSLPRCSRSRTCTIRRRTSPDS